MLSTPKTKRELFLASSLCDGLEDNDIKQVTTLLNKDADPNVLIPSQGVTPFHLVVGNESETFAVEVTKLFLRHGGNPNVRSIDGLTPVHVAAAWGRCGILELLLANGGDPLCVDDEGRNPFHYAFDGKYYRVVTILGKYCENALPEEQGNSCNVVFDKLLINDGNMVAEYTQSQNTEDSSINNSNLAFYTGGDIEKPFQKQKDTVAQSSHCSGTDLGIGALRIDGGLERQALVDQESLRSSLQYISPEESYRQNFCVEKNPKSYIITKLHPIIPSRKCFQRQMEPIRSPSNSIQCSLNASIVSRSPNFPSLNKRSTPRMSNRQEHHRFAQSTPRRRKCRDRKSIAKPKRSSQRACHLQKNLLDSEDSLDTSSMELDRIILPHQNETESLKSMTFTKCENANNFKKKETFTTLGTYTCNDDLQKGIWNSNLVGDLNVSGVEAFEEYDSENGKDLEKEVNVDESVEKVGFNLNKKDMGNKYHSIFDTEKICSTEKEYSSALSIQEEYKYEDPDQGIILLERRLCITPTNTTVNNTDATSISSDSFKTQNLPAHLLYIQNASLRRRLMELGDSPGPITSFTRRIYLKRLIKLEKKCSAIPYMKKTHIRADLALGGWTRRLQEYAELEKSAFSDFANPERRWREGVAKMSFNYLLLDSRITQDLPHRANSMECSEIWETFLSAIFYVGKGKRTRPYTHLYDAFQSWVSKSSDACIAKVRRILEIWNMGHGVVCLHVYQNTIPVEAYTREAVMIDALGLEQLCNSKSGDLYGVVATWSAKERRKLGRYLLYKAMLILMHEGERQLFPEYL